MRRRGAMTAVLALALGCGALAGGAAAQGAPAPGAFPPGRTVILPGIAYQVLASGPESGRHPTRADEVDMRYVGRLADGTIFSTSAGGGRGTSTFPVREVIPGMSAALQLMRVGDHWRITLPGYLAYGHEGRRFHAPETTLKRDIPPDATLIFDVEIAAVRPAGARVRPADAR